MNSEEKQTGSASFFRALGGFMKPYSGKYAASVVVSLLSVAANLAAYGFVGIIAGKLFSANCRWEEVFVPAAAAVICKILHAVLMNASTWISHRAAYLTLRDIRSAVTAKLMRLPVGYFEENGSGRLKTCWSIMWKHGENAGPHVSGNDSESSRSVGADRLDVPDRLAACPLRAALGDPWFSGYLWHDERV